MEPRQPCVYIMASGPRGTLYTGVTSRLVSRVWQHRTHVFEGFTSKYDVTQLVWYEAHSEMRTAIAREKAIKKWRRVWKIKLVEESNPEWCDLAESLGLSPQHGPPPSRG